MERGLTEGSHCAVCGGDVDAFCWDIKEHTHTLLTFDVVDMDREISGELEEAVSRDGVIIYEEVG